LEVIEKYFEIKDAKNVESIYLPSGLRHVRLRNAAGADQRLFRVPHHAGTRLAAGKPLTDLIQFADRFWDVTRNLVIQLLGIASPTGGKRAL
jgi:hypothetical protein